MTTFGTVTEVADPASTTGLPDRVFQPVTRCSPIRVIVGLALVEGGMLLLYLACRVLVFLPGVIQSKRCLEEGSVSTLAFFDAPAFLTPISRFAFFPPLLVCGRRHARLCAIFGSDASLARLPRNCMQFGSASRHDTLRQPGLNSEWITGSDRPFQHNARMIQRSRDRLGVGTSQANPW